MAHQGYGWSIATVLAILMTSALFAEFVSWVSSTERARVHDCKVSD